MAFSKTPSISTNTTERIDFVYNSQSRSAITPDKDSRFINVMLEAIASPNTNDARVFIKTRAGLASAYSLSGGVARGVYDWVYGGNSYCITVVGSDVRVNGVTKATLTTTTGKVGFTEHVSSVGAVTLFMADGTKGYVWSNPTTAPTMITDVNFPSPHIPDPIFIDGYIMLAKTGTQDIYNSQLDLPLSWSEGGTGGPMYISAEMYPDTIVALTKNNNYLLAIGQLSTEYFYDAANATGSPLARQDSAVKGFGTPAPWAVAQTENDVMLVGSQGVGGYTVWTIDGFKDKEIATPAIKDILLNEGVNLVNATGYCIRVSSQKLYVIRLTNRTLVYSFDTEMWTEWASGATNNINWVGTWAADGPNGKPYVLLADGTAVAAMSNEYYLDVTLPIACYITTPKYDFGSINQKTMARLSLIGEAPAGIVFYVAWSDDDYQTWVPWRTVSNVYQFPAIFQLGLFRRRAFKFAFTMGNEPVRLDGFEVDINRGNQ